MYGRNNNWKKGKNKKGKISIILFHKQYCSTIKSKEYTDNLLKISERRKVQYAKSMKKLCLNITIPFRKVNMKIFMMPFMLSKHFKDLGVNLGKDVLDLQNQIIKHNLEM